jgi:hypothetical protein
MRLFAVAAAVLGAVVVQSGPSFAATKQKRPDPPAVRTASGTVIEPTKTIIHHTDGSTTVIVIPRRRSYLDTGTEVSVGDRGFRDYMLPPQGDPGHENWTLGGPDLSGNGNYLPFASPFYLPGFNPNTPF